MKSIYLFLIVLPGVAFGNFNFSKDFSFKVFKYEKFRKELNKKAFNEENWPGKVKYDQKEYEVKYSFDEDLQDFIKRKLRRYRSDYASVVVVDNNTGKVLSATDYARDTKKFGISLTFSSTSPAASVFKVITAADLLENTEVEQDTKFAYNGRSTTLYKYQLKNKKNKWTRTLPFKKAFAKSNNVIFGKAAINRTSAKSIHNTARKFGFNEDLLQIVKSGESHVFNVSNEYNLAELASGFNKQTLMSPMHGAVIASIIANDGKLRRPSLVSSVYDKGMDRYVWRPDYHLEEVVSRDVALDLQEMMKLTVKNGTARSAFRPWKTRKISHIEVGGKTGTITGGVPYGKRDWFVSYAKPKSNDADKGISVCVMIVNVKKWYVKSTHLAKEIIQYYYGHSRS